MRLCHKAEDTVIQLKTTSATKHKQDTTGTAKQEVGVGVGTTKALSRGKSSEDDADGKFDNIFVRASRGASSKSFTTTTLVEQVGGAKPAVGMRGTASTSTSVVVHIGGYTNPMVKEGDGHLGKGNKQEESKEKDHQKEKQEEKQKDDQKGEGVGLNKLVPG